MHQRSRIYTFPASASFLTDEQRQAIDQLSHEGVHIFDRNIFLEYFFSLKLGMTIVGCKKIPKKKLKILRTA